MCGTAKVVCTYFSSWNCPETASVWARPAASRIDKCHNTQLCMLLTISLVTHTHTYTHTHTQTHTPTHTHTHTHTHTRTHTHGHQHIGRSKDWCLAKLPSGVLCMYIGEAQLPTTHMYQHTCAAAKCKTNYQPDVSHSCTHSYTQARQTIGTCALTEGHPSYKSLCTQDNPPLTFICR